MKYTDIKLQTLRDKGLIVLLENTISGGFSSVMGDRYVNSDENKKLFYVDATDLYGHSMSQMLPYDEVEMWNGHPDLYTNKLGKILNTPDDSDTVYFIEVDLKHPDKIKEKNKTSFILFRE